MRHRNRSDACIVAYIAVDFGSKSANRSENASHRKDDFLRRAPRCTNRLLWSNLKPWNRTIRIELSLWFSWFSWFPWFWWAVQCEKHTTPFWNNPLPALRRGGRGEGWKWGREEGGKKGEGGKGAREFPCCLLTTFCVLASVLTFCRLASMLPSWHGYMILKFFCWLASLLSTPLHWLPYCL